MVKKVQKVASLITESMPDRQIIHECVIAEGDKVDSLDYDWYAESEIS
jgi:hypothetical protein